MINLPNSKFIKLKISAVKFSHLAYPCFSLPIPNKQAFLAAKSLNLLSKQLTDPKQLTLIFLNQAICCDKLPASALCIPDTQPGIRRAKTKERIYIRPGASKQHWKTLLLISGACATAPHGNSAFSVEERCWSTALWEALKPIRTSKRIQSHFQPTSADGCVVTRMWKARRVSGDHNAGLKKATPIDLLKEPFKKKHHLWFPFFKMINTVINSIGASPSTCHLSQVFFSLRKFIPFNLLDSCFQALMDVLLNNGSVDWIMNGKWMQ